MNLFENIKYFFRHKPVSRRTNEGTYLTKIVVGLGNPGADLANTRHNIGFIAVDKYVKENRAVWRTLGNTSYVCIKGVTFVKPQECINKTGDTLDTFLKQFHLNKNSCKILVVVDEILLPLGQVRDKKENNPSRHNGIRNMIEQFGDSFDRVRMGIGEKPKDITTLDYVLQEFTDADMAKVKLACNESSIFIRKWIGTSNT